MESVLAIDIGGTKIAAAVVDADGTIRGRQVAPTERHLGPKAALDRSLELGRRALAQAGPVGALGLALPGLTDPTGAILRESPSAGWGECPFGPRLGDALGLPVGSDNDVRASAAGELRFGAARDLSSSFLWLTVSTGIGGALVLDGRIRRGPGALAGEVGHLVVKEDGAPCGCGGRGCLETEASGTAIARKAREALARGRPSLALEALAAPALDAAAVAQAARAGDALSRSILAEAGEALGRALASVAVLLDLEDFVLGGGVAAALDLLGPTILATMAGRMVASPRRRIRILPSALGYDAALLGAAALALDLTPKETP